MRSLGVQLPNRDLGPSRRGGLAREIFFFTAAFVATFLAALLVIGMLL